MMNHTSDVDAAVYAPIKWVVLLISIAVAGWLIWQDPMIQSPEGMHPAAAQRSLATFLVCITLWVTHLLPLAITGLLAFAMLPLLGITSARQAFSYFGNEAVFFMLGVFMLTAAMIATGLSKRLTLFLLARIDHRPRSLFAAILVSSSFLALWMPEHAVAAMMFPIVVEIVHALQLKPYQSRYACLLFLALSWGSVIGGVGTFLGGARAPLAITLLAEYYPHRSISFLQWMVAALPMVIVLTLVALLLLPRMIPIDIDNIQRARDRVCDSVSHMGRISTREWRLAGLSILTIILWMTMGPRLGLAVIAIVSACSLFALRIVTFQQVQDYINWGVLVMYGGAIAVGGALHDTQALQWFAMKFGAFELSPMWILIMMVIVAILLTECVSNAATVAVLLPVGYSLCHQTAMNPLVMTLAITIPAGLSFCLPIGSPPHAIAFASGYYRIKDMLRPALIMNMIAIILFIGIIHYYWPLIGLDVVEMP